MPSGVQFPACLTGFTFPKVQPRAVLVSHRRKLCWMVLSPREDEAAAIVAAIERFVAETAPPAGDEGEAIGPWQRAALLEGISAKGTVEDSEGGERWLS